MVFLWRSRPPPVGTSGPGEIRTYEPNSRHKIPRQQVSRHSRLFRAEQMHQPSHSKEREVAMLA